MKIKKFLSLMLLVLVAALLVACGDKAQDIANENLEKVSITYTTGDSASSVTSDVTLGKVELEGLTVEWQSDNAAISAEGKVTRPAAGGQDVSVKLTVTVKYKDATASKDFTLVVKALPEVKPLTVEITGTDKMVTGLTYTLTATVAPENATNKAVTWESDNTAVATVDADGKVTAVAPGTANIKATAKASASVVGTFAIEVADPTAESVEATIAKAAGEEGWTKGVVIATYARGFLISDGIACVLVYMNQTAFEQKVGDYVEVKGVLAEYNGSKQFTDSATITPLEEEAPKVEFKAEKLKDAAAVTAFMGAFELDKKISLRVTVTSVSASYVNAVVKDSEVAFAICYPVDSEAYVVGKDYDVTAYALYVKAYNNVDTLYVMAEKSIEVDYGFDVTITYKDGEKTENVVVNSLEFPLMELAEPEEKEGFVWLGWFTGTEEAPVRVYSIFAAADTELFARWVAAEEAPLFVDPACEDGSAYTSITEAVAAAKEGQEIILAPGEYKEELILPVERTYNTIDALKAAYCADFCTVNGRSSGDVDLFETSTAESSWMTAMLSNAEMTAKWSWLYKALAEIAENDDMDPETFTAADVRFNYMVNLYGLFSGTQHADSGMSSYVSANFANPALVKKAIIAGPKVNEEEVDTIENKIVIEKAVKITGPNANVQGQSESRNEEAEIKSVFEIKADGVIIDGCAFTEEGAIGIGANNVTINNAYIKTTKFINYGTDNRKGSIANMENYSGFTLLNTYICTPGTSYLNEAIAIDGRGMTDVTIDHCYFDTDATAPAAYECIIAYKLFGEFIFTNNECYFTTTGYFARLGLYSATLTYALVKDNVFAGVGDNANATFAFAKITDNGATIEFIHNKFYNFAPSTIILGTAATVKTNFLYNYFDELTPWKFDNGTDINFDYNIVLGEAQEGNKVDATAQANVPADLDALEAAYALYKAELEREATITFDVDGGEAVEAIKFKEARTVVLPTPVKEGYEFLGWFNGETKVEAITEKVDVTLKAHWVKINKVTFDTDGGNDIEDIEFTDFTKVTLPNPTKTGFAFAGWVENGTPVTELSENRDYALKATWSTAKVVTFDMDGGEQIDPITFEDYTTVVLPTTATKAGFMFDGWYDGDTKVTALSANADITLKAHWIPAYTVTFDVDGGTAIDPIVFVDYTTVELPIAVKSGMIFKEWTAGGVAVTELAENANIELKATYYTFAEKMASIAAGDTVIIPAGTYTSAEAITISVDNVTLVGADAETVYAKDYAYNVEAAHTVFNGIKILLADGVKGFTMKGITLTGASGLAGNGTNEDVTFTNNIINNIGTVTVYGSTDGVVGFNSVKNLVITNNAITGTDDTARIFRNIAVRNLTFTGNIFTDSFAGYSQGAGGDLLRIDDGGALKGTAIISNNIFQNSSQCAVHTRSLEDVVYVSENNYFYNCNGGYWLKTYTGEVDVIIAHNYFEGGGSSWDVVGSNAGYNRLIVTYNYFKQAALGSGCYSVLAPGANNYIANNYYEGVAANKVNGVELAAENISKLADPKAVAFMGTDAFDAWMGKGLYYSSFEAASADEALVADSTLVLLSGNYSGNITKQLTISSVLDQFPVEGNEDLYESAAAATINGELVFNAVAKAGLNHVAITGAGQVYTYGAAVTKFTVDNAYAFDSTFTPVAYALNGILNTGANNTSTKFAVFQIQGLNVWNGGLSFTNCKFDGITGGAIMVIGLSGGLTVDKCSFNEVTYDAISCRYASGAGGAVTVKDSSFDTIGANGLYIRSATGTWTGDLNTVVTGCSFVNVAYDAEALTALDNGANYGCIVTRGYGEKYSCDFTITNCSFELCKGYINIRDNATTTATWRQKGVHYLVTVKYCSFVVAEDDTKISHSFVGSDSSTTNVGDMLFDNNYYAKNVEGELVVATVTYDDILEESNATTYDSLAALENAWEVYNTPVEG